MYVGTSLTLNYDSERNAQRLRDAYVEGYGMLLADLVGRYISIDWCATCYTQRGESRRRTLAGDLRLACATAPPPTPPRGRSTNGRSGLIHGYSRFFRRQVGNKITSGKKNGKAVRLAAVSCPMIAIHDLQCAVTFSESFPIRSRGPEGEDAIVGRRCRFCHRCIARLCCEGVQEDMSLRRWLQSWEPY